MNRPQLAALVLASGIAAAFVLGRTADAAALPDDEADEPDATGSTALDWVNPWRPIAVGVAQYRTRQDAADVNAQAFLTLIAWAEGTEREPDPYRVCYGYRHVIRDLSRHPAVPGPDGSREWAGERLPDHYCRGAGLNPGCVSTAAGRYQIIRPTWLRCARALGLEDFGPASQDAAALYLIRQRGALDAVREGRIADAVALCRQEWASLPGNTAGQPQRRLGDLIAAYERAGGTLA